MNEDGHPANMTFRYHPIACKCHMCKVEAVWICAESIAIQHDLSGTITGAAAAALSRELQGH